MSVVDGQPMTLAEAEAELARLGEALAQVQAERKALDDVAEAERPALEAELSDLAALARVGEADPGRVERRRAEISGRFHELEEQVAELARAEDGIRRRGDAVATAIQRALDADDREEAASELAAIEEARRTLYALEEAHEQGEIRRQAAAEGRRFLRARFNRDVSAAAQMISNQEREKVRSLARMPAWRREQATPPRLRAAVAEEVARLALVAEAEAQRDRELAARKWEEAGLSGSPPDFLS